jgi:hypothetical protein
VLDDITVLMLLFGGKISVVLSICANTDWGETNR